jgi:hypothetical protein
MCWCCFLCECSIRIITLRAAFSASIYSLTWSDKSYLVAKRSYLRLLCVRSNGRCYSLHLNVLKCNVSILWWGNASVLLLQWLCAYCPLIMLRGCWFSKRTRSCAIMVTVLRGGDAGPATLCSIIPMGCAPCWLLGGTVRPHIFGLFSGKGFF